MSQINQLSQDIRQIEQDFKNWVPVGCEHMFECAIGNLKFILDTLVNEQ